MKLDELYSPKTLRFIFVLCQLKFSRLIRVVKECYEKEKKRKGKKGEEIKYIYFNRVKSLRESSVSISNDSMKI